MAPLGPIRGGIERTRVEQSGDQALAASGTSIWAARVYALEKDVVLSHHILHKCTLLFNISVPRTTGMAKTSGNFNHHENQVYIDRERPIGKFSHYETEAGDKKSNVACNLMKIQLNVLRHRL